MALPLPCSFSRSKVDKAGERIADENADSNADYEAALSVVNAWRSAHAYPLNTFQATLRNRLRRIEKGAIVAQRLKRTPAIVRKIKLGTKLSRMCDIG